MPRPLAFAFALATPLLWAGGAPAQQLSQPVFRVAANQPQASQPAAQAPPVADPSVRPASTLPELTAAQSNAAQSNAAQSTATQLTAAPSSADQSRRPAGLENSPFDVVEVPGEHPLMPSIRLAEQGLAEIDTNIRCYTAVVTKTERIAGVVGEPQQMAIKVRHEPFSVHMKFIQPFAGREVLYNPARNEGKLVALEGSGWKRRFGKIKLDPNGSLAMTGQRYPITNMGVRFLTTELLKIAKNDIQYAECSVRYSSNAKIDGRPVTMIEATHPTPRRNFRFHIARIFVDHELRIPTGYEAFSWPPTPGAEPILEERYIYTNVVLNPPLTDADFDETNPNLFR